MVHHDIKPCNRKIEKKNTFKNKMLQDLRLLVIQQKKEYVMFALRPSK